MIARDPVGPGQESVWDYPRPAVAEPTPLTLKIEFAGRVVAETRRGVRTLETSHPPGYYFPPDDIDIDLLHAEAGRGSLCEWKGAARYFNVLANGRKARRAAWSYPDPTDGFAILRDFVAFYASAMDACFVDGERVGSTGGRLLRRLDHLARGRSVQGPARHAILVNTQRIAASKSSSFTCAKVAKLSATP